MPAASASLPVEPKPKAEPPHIFGYGLRDRVLMTLAVNRPLYVTELSEIVRSDTRKVRNTLLPLLRTGVIVKDNRLHGARYVGLNKTWPAYLQMLRFLRALEKRWPQERTDKPARKAERFALRDLLLEPDDSEISAVRLDPLFYSPVRTRTLLAIAAVGDTDVTDLHATFNIERRSAEYVTAHWQREGLIRATVKGRRRALELDPRFYAARELRLLLLRLIETTHEYSMLALYSRRNPESPKFVAIR